MILMANFILQMLIFITSINLIWNEIVTKFLLFFWFFLCEKMIIFWNKEKFKVIQQISIYVIG